MNEIELVDNFFSQKFESGINESSFYRDYVWPEKQIHSYISDLLRIEPRKLLEKAISISYPTFVQPGDIFQFSSLDDCLFSLPKVIVEKGDEGYKFDAVGALLLPPVPNGRDHRAETKYGENAAKTAALLGLVQIKDNYVFSSCLTRAFLSMPFLTKCSLLPRLVLRTKYFSMLLQEASKEPVPIDYLTGSLSDSTRKRRKPNLVTIFKILRFFEDKDIDRLLDQVIL